MPPPMRSSKEIQPRGILGWNDAAEKAADKAAAQTVAAQKIAADKAAAETLSF